ncbi:hypothetical protein JTB14_014397 [Gonioctena quinquepunctata]|nr:hypothetical protein JTB14_014397 [Gonioctena quinquepunctata]
MSYNFRVKLLPPRLRSSLVPLVQHERKSFLSRGTTEGEAARRAVKHPGRPYTEFSVGDPVLLRANNGSSAKDSKTKKIPLLFEGPYVLKEAVSFASYVLVDPLSSQERGTFHASHLRRYFSKEGAAVP